MAETKPAPDAPKADNTLPEEPKLSDEEKKAAKEKKENYDKQMATVTPYTSPGAAPVLKDDLRAAKKKEADEETERQKKAKDEQARADAQRDRNPKDATQLPAPTTEGDRPDKSGPGQPPTTREKATGNVGTPVDKSTSMGQASTTTEKR